MNTNSVLRNEHRPLEDRKPAPDMTLPELVREYTEQRVWFAVNEVTRRVPEGNARHRRLGAVVDELRARRALD